MKILMLSDFYPPVIGGMERHVKLLSEGLSARGHTVTVCTIDSGGLPSYEKQGRVTIYRLGGLFQRIPFLFTDNERKFHPPLQDYIITSKLEELIRHTKPDIVHAHGWILFSGLALKKRCQVPVIATVHDFGLICPKRSMTKRSGQICTKPFGIECVNCGLDVYSLWKSFFVYASIRTHARILQDVDTFIAVSQFVKDTCLKYLELDEKKLVVIPNFYSVEEDFRLKARISLPKDFILFVGTLVPSKGVDLLIDTYSRLRTKTKLVMIGSRHRAYSYKNRKNIIVLENVSHESVMKACAACRFLVAPGISPEACPTVIMEAMNFKKAVVASDIGAMKEMVVNGTTGIMFPSSNSVELERAIGFLLDNPEKARMMGENGFDLVRRRYSLVSVLPKIEKIYSQFQNH
jgi:glycosyltransferase involved in cell wall biosynthesis